MEKDVATRMLWSMIPETKAFCPRGVGMVPYMLPSSVELADATIKAIDDDYDVVMWEKHGVFAVDTDIMSAFDQVDVLNKSALIYIASKNMGFEPDGMSDAQMKELSDVFGLPAPEYDDSKPETITPSIMDVGRMVERTGFHPRDMRDALEDIRRELTGISR